jgi:translation initiation factor eIF-2B subunit epsilon
VSIPLELYKEHHNVVFTDQMMDCQIDICSPEVLVKFSDNFDYQDIRRDMIINEVTNYELGGHIYSWTIRGEYAARVHDPRTYHAVCEDIIRRWLFPIVPESNFSFSQRTNYVQTKRYIYKEGASCALHSVLLRPLACPCG